MTAAAGSSRSDSSIALPSSSGSARTAASASGWASRWAIALAIIPSVVSIPPNRSTAAFDITSSRESPPASPAAAASSEDSGARPSAGAIASRSAA